MRDGRPWRSVISDRKRVDRVRPTVSDREEVTVRVEGDLCRQVVRRIMCWAHGVGDERQVSLRGDLEAGNRGGGSGRVEHVEQVATRGRADRPRSVCRLGVCQLQAPRSDPERRNGVVPGVDGEEHPSIGAQRHRSGRVEERDPERRVLASPGSGAAGRVSAGWASAPSEPRVWTARPSTGAVFVWT